MLTVYQILFPNKDMESSSYPRITRKSVDIPRTRKSDRESSCAEKEIGVTIILLEAEYGTADIQTLFELERSLLVGINATKDALVIDFRETSFLNVEFLNALLRCHLRAKSRNRRFVLCELKPWPQKVFTVTRLDSLWEIFDTRQQASEAVLGTHDVGG